MSSRDGRVASSPRRVVDEGDGYCPFDFDEDNEDEDESRTPNTRQNRATPRARPSPRASNCRGGAIPDLGVAARC
jgi:hypothetical protein